MHIVFEFRVSNPDFSVLSAPLQAGLFSNRSIYLFFEFGAFIFSIFLLRKKPQKGTEDRPILIRSNGSFRIPLLCDPKFRF